MPDTIYDARHRAWDRIPDTDLYRRRDRGWIALTAAELDQRHGTATPATPAPIGYAIAYTRHRLIAGHRYDTPQDALQAAATLGGADVQVVALTPVEAS